MRRHPLFHAYLALIAVCFFWGTTYVSIRMALESLPPLLIVCVRFTLSGSIMLACALPFGVRLPKGRELWLTALYGVMTLTVGNTCLVLSEMWIPSGIAALFITTSPFWMVGAERILPRGERLHLPTILGMTVGFAGTGLLAFRDLRGGGGAHYIWGFLILQFSTACWSLGAILQRRQPTLAHPVVSGAIQQLATGVSLAPAVLLAHEHAPVWTFRSTAALLYLVVFGSIVGYSAFIYAMDKLPVALVSIYTYINPVVAVILGWFFYREQFGPREMLGMTIIFVGVALVKRYSPHFQTKASATSMATAEQPGG